MLFLDRCSINLSALYIEDNYLVIDKYQKFALIFRSFGIEYYFGVIFHVFWYASNRLNDGFSITQVLNASYEDCPLNIHGGQHAIRWSNVCADYLIVMVVYYYGIIFVAAFFEVPYLYGLIHGARYKLGIMKQQSVNVIIVRLEIIYACSRLKTEDVNVVVFASECKGFLTGELTSD